MSDADYKYIKIKVKDLLLDDKNYRFPFSMTDRSQSAIIKYLLNNEDAKKIVSSINEYGYLPNNALYVIKDTNNKDKYIVKEGNRRCAAVKSLANPNLYGLKYTKTSIKEIDCYLFENSKLLEDLILSRHTQSEIKSWHRLQQARYVKDMIDNGTLIEDIKVPQASILYKLALFCESLLDNNKDVVSYIEMNNVSTVFERLFSKDLESYLPFKFTNSECIIKDSNEFNKFIKSFYKLVEEKKADTRSLLNTEKTKQFLLDNMLISEDKKTPVTIKEQPKGKKDENKKSSKTENTNSITVLPQPKEQKKLFVNINFSPLMVKYPSYCELAQELQSIDFKKKPYSAFVLLRMFIEGALKIYLTGLAEYIKEHKNKTKILSTYQNLLKDIEITDFDGLENAISKMRKVLSLKNKNNSLIIMPSSVFGYFNSSELDDFKKETNKIVHKNSYPAVSELVKRYGNPMADVISFLLFKEDYNINEIYL